MTTHLHCTVILSNNLQSDKAASLDISTNDFVSPSFFPHDLTSADAQPLVHGFIASNRITDFMSRFKLQIVQRLIPGLRKDGYTEEPDSNVAGSNPPRSDNPQPARPRPQEPPHAPDYYPSNIPPENPLSIGRSDLDPFPGMNPSNPFAPSPLFPPHGGDGMFVGPDHPIFSGRVPGGLGGRPGPGRWGGDGFLPPMGAPPGARFDPVGPGPFPGGIGGIGGRGRGSGGPPGGGNMRGPDNDEFMPPGMVSMMFSLVTLALTVDRWISQGDMFM
jgi:proteasome inhibitor subunit 1 (PI31)